MSLCIALGLSILVAVVLLIRGEELDSELELRGYFHVSDSEDIEDQLLPDPVEAATLVAWLHQCTYNLEL
jgi:hypothetical protein